MWTPWPYSYYCNYNQSNDGFQKERQVLHRTTRPNYRQIEESSTYEEENQSDVDGTASQLESQENALTNPNLLQKMKPTRTSNRVRKPRNPNQKPRKLQMPSQSNVQLQLRRITLYLKESPFPCEFQVVQNLAYDAIPGRDFHQVNRAMTDLDNNTITLKESATQQEQACSASAPLPHPQRL